MQLLRFTLRRRLIVRLTLTVRACCRARLSMDVTDVLIGGRGWLFQCSTGRVES